MTAPLVYLDGQYLPLNEARISPDDRGFLFGDGVYESLRYYPVPAETSILDGIFGLDRHLARLARSLRGVRLEGVDTAGIPAIATELVERNDLRSHDATIYLQITRGVAPRTHVFPGAGSRPTVYAIARRFEPPVDQWERGIEVALVDDVRWGRCDVKSIALLANVLASEQAREQGATEAVFVREGEITEGAHTAVAFVVDGRLRTHPETSRILPSVTRALVLELCASLSIEVEERPLRRDELGSVQEMIVLGTTTEVMPVVRVDGVAVGAGVPGPVTRRLQTGYRELRSASA